MVVHERLDTHVSQGGECYQNGAFSQLSQLFQILMVGIVRLRLSLASQKGLTIGEKRRADKISEDTEKKDLSADVDGEDSKKKCRIM